MKKIQQYCNKKNLCIGTIVGGLIGVILFFMVISMKNYTTNIKSFSDLESLVGVIKNFCNIYYLNLIFLLVITVAYGLRLFKLNEQTLETKIFTGGSGGALLLSVISLSGISTLKSVTSGNFSSITGLRDAEGQMKLIVFMILLQVAFACYAGFLVFKNKGTQQDDIISKTTQKSESDINIEATSKPEVSIVEKMNTYYATKNGKKNICVWGAVIGVVLIAFIGISVFNSMKRTPIDLTKNCEISFNGVSGEGYADVNCKADYDMNNAEIKNFVYSITYKVENNGTLKNGDTIKINATYSEATADSLKLQPENTTKEVKVEGLEVVYMKFKDIPSKISTKFESSTKEMLEAELKKKVGGFFAPSARSIDKMECIAIYYDYSPYTGGTAYYIYRAEETIQHNSTNTEKQINYYNVNIKNINSVKEVNLKPNSDDLDYSLISTCDKEETDEMTLNSFKSSHEDVQTVKENPNALTYKNETINE